MDSPFPINPAGFLIHSCVHDARDDAKCVMHTHSINGVAVSCQKDGVLPISQQSLYVLVSLAYHDYEGVALNDDERPRLAADLIPIPDRILASAKQMKEEVTHGLGGVLAWPGLLRKLDRDMPGYDQ
jgi:hypothetical protein